MPTVDQLRHKVRGRFASLSGEVELRSMEDVLAMVGIGNLSKRKLADLGAEIVGRVVVRENGKPRGRGKLYPGDSFEMAYEKMKAHLGIVYQTEALKRAEGATDTELERIRLQGIGPTDKQIAQAMGHWDEKNDRANTTFNTYMREKRERALGKLI